MFIAKTPGNGVTGGIVYDAQGIDTDIYLSGPDPESGTADGKLRAPSGGSGGFDATFTQFVEASGLTGDGGDGGDGYDFGDGGVAGTLTGTNLSSEGSNGTNGKIDGTGTGFGVDGVDNDATKGLKGKGLVKGGATVRVFGDTPSNFINGSGDTPDP